MKKMISIIIAVGLLGGCATESGMSRLPMQKTDVTAEARAKVQSIQDVWFQQQDRTQTISGLNRLATQYSSRDGKWEIACYTMMAMAHIESGEVENFHEAVRKLRQNLRPNQAVHRTTQYVLAVDDAMHGTTTSDVMIENRISAVARSLLGDQSGGQ